ncbi:hypothetical protein [Actinomadura sp. 7K534]|uniref:terpene synthase family protein n=1 Tax=Actinomadura sp. 7K534 TaxID=2530366 RepID=UPI001052110F|nr:hypothetical protein [Actinomadura sp. 7K534]TDB98605.1 hypothetical protein E1266_02380 [Actinomadura sp. 7K534]
MEKIDVTGLPAATPSGAICAVAGQAGRETQRWAERYGRLFSAKPFDPTLYNTVCLCTAFSAPWATSDELQLTNRTAVWGFGVDWRIDYVATSRAEVDDVVAGCLAVADGEPPADDDLMLSLADIRDGLAESPAFPALLPAWRDQLARFLHAMAHEWDWRSAGKRPTLAEYLDNSDNFGFSFAFLSQWISASPPPGEADIAAIQAASWAAQRAGRLINDIGSYERDVEWGDLNALLLDVGRDEIDRHVAELTGRFREVVVPLREDHPRLAYYLERQIDFCIGFYGETDYWGTL